MRTSSYLLTLSILALVGCAGEPTTVTTTTTQEVTTTGPAREVVVTRQPPPVRLETQTIAPGPGIRLDTRLLAMDRNDLCVGAGILGSPSKTSRSLGGRSLGASLQRVGMGRRSLAIADTAENRHQPRTLAKMRGATIVASDSMMNFGVSTLSFPHVIFSFGTAPEYDPKLVVESLIWQK